VSEESGGGDGQDGLGDHGFDHEVDEAVELSLAQAGNAAVAVEEGEESLAIEMVGPVGGIGAVADDGELEHAVG